MCAPPPGFDDVSHLPGTQGDAHNSDGKRTRQIPCKKMVVARLKGEKEGRKKKMGRSSSICWRDGIKGARTVSVPSRSVEERVLTLDAPPQ